MYRKIVWCYVLVLTLLDISLNTKLTAQGKSHDVTVQDSFIEGISFQEWGKESLDQGLGTGAAAEALRLEPASLRFGRAALGAAHALTVALTNTANSTVHLASVAGTTPDFHASFFESKTLPPNGNTTFSVVYLGRREGPVAAHLYIHTSLGVYKYPVSAEGVASAWGVWPLVGLRVPHNATLDPVLTLYNPTDKPVQVREVYSSGSWVGLRLPGGGGAAPREAWRVPPQQERALVRLKLRLPPPAVPHAAHTAHTAQPRPLTAYIRIKGDNVGGGGGLVVAVEAAAAPAGTFLLPPVLSLRASGSRDPPHTVPIRLLYRIKGDNVGGGGGLVVAVEAAAAPAGTFLLPPVLSLRASGSRDPPHTVPIRLLYRIKGDNVGGGGGLVVAVEAAAAPAGTFLLPPVLSLRASGSRDPPHTVPIRLLYRIKGDNVGGGGGLVVAVEAAAAPAGTFLLPPVLSLRASGSRDPPHTVPIRLLYRIKGDNVGGGGGLVVAVEAAAAPAGTFLLPPVLSLRASGSRDPPHTVPIRLLYRIKGDNVGGGGGLVVAVEAAAAPAGTFLLPPVLSLRASGSRDPPHTVPIRLLYRIKGDNVGGGGGLVVAVEAAAAPAGTFLLPPVLSLRASGSRDPPHTVPIRLLYRIKGDNVGGGGGLVVAVEAAAAPAGTFLLPPVLSLRASGSRDPPHTFDILAGNSGSTPERVEASLWGARCAPRPVPLVPPPDAPPQQHNGQQLEKTTTNGVKPEGAYLSLLRSQLDPHQEATETLQLTLDFARLWASYTSGGAGVGAAPPEQGAWCGGYVRLGASSLPYSLRLLPGTLHLTPAELEVVTASRDEALREREVRVRNEFPVPVLISAIDYGPEIEKHFHVGALTPLVLQPGAEAVAARVRLRAVTGTSLRAALTLRTNLTRLSLPVLLHAGALHLEWEWPNSSDGHLRMGAVSVSSTRRVSLRIHNPAPATLCVRSHALRLPAAQLALPACRCIKPGERAQAWLTVVAPARAGVLTGSVHVSTAHFESRAPVSLHAHQGRLRAHALRLAPAAPYVWSTAPLVLESSMAMNMRVVDVTQLQPDPAVSFMPEGQGWVTAGTQAVGAVEYAPERACRPRCYTGLDTDSPEGAAWLRRAQEGAGALREDVELLRARRAMFSPRVQNVSLLLHTTEVVQIPVSGSVRAEWPRLLAGAGAGAGGLLAGVGGAAAARLRLRNPSTRALLLHAALTPHHLHRPHPHHAHHDPDHLLHPKDVEGLESFCKKHKCVWSAEAFSIGSWQARAGAAGVAEHAAGNATRAPVLLLPPGAELELTLSFAPTRAAPLAAYLYLRNNLTIVEIIPVWGRGAYPSLELGGRRPGSGAPIVFEVTECASPTDVEAGVVRRALSLHNTGDVPLQLRDWRLAGQPCQARGFRLQPCAAISLAPNESRPLRLAFTADYTLARVAAALHVRADAARLEFALHAHAPAALLRACGPHAPRPPFEPGLRAAGVLLALAALALVAGAGAVDAERSLRRARAQRPGPPPARAPLDLRAVCAPPAPPRPPPAAARRRRARRPPPLDPQAERRAFERWRAEVLRRAPADDDRSSEDADAAAAMPPPESEQRDRSASPPTPTDRRSSDEEEGPSAESSVGSSLASDSSRADEPGRDDSDEPDRPATPRRPPRPRRQPIDPENRAEDARLATRARREASSPPRLLAPARARAPPGRSLARRDKAARRRASRPPASPPRASPPQPAPAPPAPAAPAAVRWDTTWSSVVAAGAAAAAAAAPGQPAGGRSPADLYC
ncbi:uncharacterized protein LOC135080991 [Ostrinia nubilalis]|uniref:uncharacterized protein LOC135080991 n=1 Tax=Ostrinia nubilalis TaxID=29057 RepID=UPI0030823B91